MQHHRQITHICPDCGEPPEVLAAETHKPAFVAALAGGICSTCADDYSECVECGTPTTNASLCDGCSDAVWRVEEARRGYADLMRAL